MLVPTSISMTLCLNFVPFLRYSASKNGVSLKLGVGVVQGHWKDHIRLFIGPPLYHGTVFELLDVKKYRDLEIWVRVH